MKAVLFKSRERFTSFCKKLKEYDIETKILDFDDHEWEEYDYSDTDMLLYYPSFEYSSNHPLALQRVYDNIVYLHETWPHITIFPDPKAVKYYNDKYRQYLFLNGGKYPVPETIPLFSEKSVELADKTLGYPMIIKNRYGAGGGSVYRIHNKKELLKFYQMSKMDLFHFGVAKFLGKMLTERLFYWQLIKAKKARYPFFSPPILAQKFVKIDRDLKTVVGNNKVVEAHWRFQADESMWKMNIDGGGTGVWGHVPQEALDLSVRLAKDLKASWINIDLMQNKGRFLISEFSPVWHHYAYKENPAFIYKDNYNIDVPLEVSLDLERIIVESLIKAVKWRGDGKGKGKAISDPA